MIAPTAMTARSTSRSGQGLAPPLGSTTSLPAGGTVAWNEVWYVVSQSGGVTFANQNASLYAWRDGDVDSPDCGRPGGASLASDCGAEWRRLSADQIFDVRPDTPFRASSCQPHR